LAVIFGEAGEGVIARGGLAQCYKGKKGGGIEVVVIGFGGPRRGNRG